MTIRATGRAINKEKLFPAAPSLIVPGRPLSMLYSFDKLPEIRSRESGKQTLLIITHAVSGCE